MKIVKGWVIDLFLYAIRDNDVGGWGMGGGGDGAITNDVLITNFKVHELWWTTNKLCTCLIIDEKRSPNIYETKKKTCEIK